MNGPRDIESMAAGHVGNSQILLKKFITMYEMYNIKSLGVLFSYLYIHSRNLGAIVIFHR